MNLIYFRLIMLICLPLHWIWKSQMSSITNANIHSTAFNEDPFSLWAVLNCRTWLNIEWQPLFTNPSRWNKYQLPFLDYILIFTCFVSLIHRTVLDCKFPSKWTISLLLCWIYWSNKNQTYSFVQAMSALVRLMTFATQGRDWALLSMYGFKKSADVCSIHYFYALFLVNYRIYLREINLFELNNNVVILQDDNILYKTILIP